MTMTLRKLITTEMLQNKDSFDDILKITLNDDELDKEIPLDGRYIGYYASIPFYCWTSNYIYFMSAALVFDPDFEHVKGTQGTWVESIPRNPSLKAPKFAGKYFDASYARLHIRGEKR